MDHLSPTVAKFKDVGESENATSVRWRILALLMAYAALCHFNRISISVAGTEHIIGQHHAITETQMGMIYSAYLLIYTICMMPGGWFIDRFGPKRALLLLGAGSAILVPLTGSTYAMSGMAMLITLFVIRSLLGVVSAPMHPGAARMVSYWLPYHARGVANGMVTGSALIGITSTYFVFGGLMDAVGWPFAFVISGAITLLVTFVWGMVATDKPSEHPAVNSAEQQLIEDGDLFRLGAPLKPESAGAVLRSLLGNRSLVLLTLSFATLSYFQYLFFYWMQYYFDEVLKLTKDEGRLYAAIPTLAMAAGMMSGGWIGDLAAARFGDRRGRQIVPILGMIASAVLLALGLIGENPRWVVAFFALAMGALGVSEPAFWVIGIGLGRRRGGLSAAFLNTGGNAGGILGPLLTPLISNAFGWKTGLSVASVLCALGAVLWWGVDPYDGQSPATPHQE